MKEEFNQISSLKFEKQDTENQIVSHLTEKLIEILDFMYSVTNE